MITGGFLLMSPCAVNGKGSMEKISKFLSRLVWATAALLTLRVVVWFFEQRTHDKEYWLIFAHVVPFLLVIFSSAITLVFIKNFIVRKLSAKKTDR